MAFTSDFLLALGTYLADSGPGLAWRPDGTPYAPAEVGLYVDKLPTDPDRGVAMAVYPVDSDTGTTDSTLAVQFRARGRRNRWQDVKDAEDALFSALDGATGYDLGPTPVIRSWRQSGTNLPADGNGRAESTSNYYFRVTRPTPHRRD